MHGFPILSLLTFIPVIGIIIVLSLPKDKTNLIKYTALLATGLQVIFAAILLMNYDYSAAGIFDEKSFQFIEKFRWIEIKDLSFLGTVKIDYFLGIEG